MKKLKVSKAKLDKHLALNAMSAADLAEATGLSVMTISKLSRGVTTPRATTIRKITKVLNCKPVDILDITES